MREICKFILLKFIASPLFPNQVQKLFYINIETINKNELLSFLHFYPISSYLCTLVLLRVLTTDISC